jgi:cytochrome c biogenesis protein ResB
VFSDGGKVYAEKNRWLPFVPYIIHIAVLAFMLAHLIGGLYGYRHPGLHINEGETTVAPTGDYQIRLDKVKVEQREDGSLKEYGSLLTAIKDGKEISHGWVTANKPMFVEGGAIYQRDFGQNFNGLILAVTDKSTGFSNYLVAPKGAMYVKIPGSTYRLRVDRFLAAFELDRNGEPFSNTNELVNPAIFVTVMNGNTPGGSGWVLLREPNMDSLKDPVVDVKLADISMLSYSGFDVNRDPSAGLALIASFTVLFGSCITLYVRRQRVWANVEGGRAQVVCTDEDLYEKLKG